MPGATCSVLAVVFGSFSHAFWALRVHELHGTCGVDRPLVSSWIGPFRQEVGFGMAVMG